eukprot:3075138-Amphidinium_carterae.1
MDIFHSAQTQYHKWLLTSATNCNCSCTPTVMTGISTAFASVAETGCLKVHSATGSLVHSDMKE